MWRKDMWRKDMWRKDMWRKDRSCISLNLDKYAEGVGYFQPRVGAQRQLWDRMNKEAVNPVRVPLAANPFRVGLYI